MRASGSLRKPKRRPSVSAAGLGRPEKTTTRLCRASQGSRKDGYIEIIEFYRTSSPVGLLPCMKLEISNILCPAVHISGSLYVYCRKEGIVDFGCFFFFK